MEKRIYGLETEYAVIIVPEENTDFIPTRKDVFEVLTDVISSHYRILDSKEPKQGSFLQNGGRFHHEACLNALLEGVIEFSTPECLTPFDVSLYGRVYDEILEEIREEIEIKLNLKGFSGKILFGKNSTDNKGNFYGTHENYLVDDPVTGFDRFLLKAVFVIFFTTFILAIIAINLPILTFILLLFIFYILFALLRLLLTPLLSVYNLLTRSMDFLLELIRVISGQKPSSFTKIFGEFFRLFTLPWAYSCGFFLRQIVFKKITRFLTPFIMTRIIFCGPGHLLSEDATENSIPFTLSQKAEAIKSVCTIFWDDFYKPVFSLKNFIKSPFSIFNNEKRLHIMYSDSNMSDYITYLKVGITGLIIRMIEENHPFEDLNPSDPIRALMEFSRDLTMKKKIKLKNGKSMTSLEIQKYYLQEAKVFYSDNSSEDIKKLLHSWENILSSIEINPHMLYKELEWVAKKDLINEVLRQKGKSISFSTSMLKWFKIFQELFRETSGNIDENILKLQVEQNFSFWKKRSFRNFLVKEKLSLPEFIERFLLYYQLQKINLKFHELNKKDGYYYKLVSAGLIKNIADKDDIKRGKLYPPSDTRASIRGSLISELALCPVKAQIGWDDVIIYNHTKFIYFYDPFQKELSEEDKNYIKSLSY